MKKLYIFGTNLSGKGYLSQLLDNIDNFIVFPYHKFGYSFVYDEFINFLRSKNKYIVDSGYFNTSNKHVIKICLNINNIIEYRDISVGELIWFMFREMQSIKYLLQWSMTNHVIAYSGDDAKHVCNYEFDIYKLIENFKNKLINNNGDSFNIEQLDDILYSSYLNVIYNNIKLPKDIHFVVWGSNINKNYNHLNVVKNEYINSNIIFIKRDYINMHYSNCRRIASKIYNFNDNNIIYEMMKNYLVSNYLKYKKDLNYIQSLDNILIIQFDDMFNNNVVIMETIHRFLNIDYNNGKIFPSLMGMKIRINYNYDNVDNIFTPSQLKCLNNILHKKICNIYNLKNLGNNIEVLYYNYIHSQILRFVLFLNYIKNKII